MPDSVITLASLRARRFEIEAVAERRGARNLWVFGSVARGEARITSDVDLLVDLDPDRGLFDLGGLTLDLADLLGTRVDVVTRPSLDDRMRTRVLEEAVPL